MAKNFKDLFEKRIYFESRWTSILKQVLQIELLPTLCPYFTLQTGFKKVDSKHERIPSLKLKNLLI